jgi:hypothetical protein
MFRDESLVFVSGADIETAATIISVRLCDDDNTARFLCSTSGSSEVKFLSSKEGKITFY